MARTSFYETPPRPRRPSWEDGKMNFEDLGFDPRDVIDEGQENQLSNQITTWIQQFNVFGPVRNYVQFVIQNSLVTTDATQSRQTRGVALVSFEINDTRFEIFDPSSHETNLPAIPISQALEVIDMAYSSLTARTLYHKRRSFPVYYATDSCLSMEELQVLSLVQLAESSFVSQAFAEEISSQLAEAQNMVALLNQDVIDPDKLVGEDGVTW